MRVSTFFIRGAHASGTALRYDDRRMGGGAFTLSNGAAMTSLDVACGMPLGRNDRKHAPALRHLSLDDFAERLFSCCFGRGPCYIPFSGGRESSMLIAIGTRYARRHGYRDPVPITLRSPDLGSAEQIRLQERVIAHVGLTDWERVELKENLDLIGEVAARTLLRTGPLWPPNAYMMVPLLEAARDGVFVLVTGFSDFFSYWCWAPLSSLLAGHRRPAPRDVALLGAMLMPAPMRARMARRRGVPPPMPWLRAPAEQRALAMMARRQAEVPVHFDRAMRTQVTHRCFDTAARTIRGLGEAFGTTTDLPLCRPEVVASLSSAGGWRGFDGLTDLLQRLCGDLLPAGALAARSGPDLTRMFFGERTREFAASWDGGGLDESLVDPEMLRRNWLSDRPDSRTACLLQHAWLSEQVSCPGFLPTAGELVVTHSNRKEAP